MASVAMGGEIGASPSRHLGVAGRRQRRRSPLGRVSSAHVIVVLAGLVGALLTLAALRGAEHTVGVVVLRHDVGSGMELNSSDIATTRVHVDDETLATLIRSSDRSRVPGSVVIAPLRRGDVLRRSDLRPVAATRRRRSMSFAVDSADAVAGVLQIGDRIDVVGVTRTGEDSGYVVTNAEVLAVSNPDVSGPLRSSDRRVTLTVVVDGDAALRLVAAQASGRLVVVNATGADPLTRPRTFTNNSPTGAANATNGTTGA